MTSQLRTAFIAAGNGLPEIEVLPTDSVAWVQEQLALRSNAAPASGDIHTPSDATSAPAAQTASYASTPDLTQKVADKVVGAITSPLKAVVILAMMLLLGVALVALGAYQFTKD